MPQPAGRRWRSLLRAGHRWFGLAGALWLILMSLTGSAIVFYGELDRWLNPDLWTVPASEVAAPLDRAVERAGEALPGFAPRFIDLPDAPDDAVMMTGTVAQDGAAARSVQVFTDPRDGTVLGWRFFETVAFDRRHLMTMLYDLHLDLMLGPAMTWFLGLVALLWIADHAAALVLAFPVAAKWRASFRVGGPRGSLRRLFDLHRAKGVWLFPVTLVLAVSSLALTWHEEVRWAARLVAPVSERLHLSFPDRPAEAHAMRPPVGIDAALAVAGTRSGARIDSVVVLSRKGVYGVRAFDDRDMDGYGRLWIYVSMQDGAILGQRHDRGEGPGDAFFAWQYPLHSGKAFGLPGRIVVLVAGLATVALCVTGLWLWWRRR